MTILDDIQAYIGQYVAFTDPAQADVIAAYVLHTHAFDLARTTPYLYVTSAEKQSGKTRTLEVLETICAGAVRAGGLTSASMMRVIEHLSPTLMIDEVDTIFSGSKNEELRSVLNNGYKSGGFIYRALGNPNDDDGGLVRYGVFCPKILAGIDNGYVPDTIQDRSIRITLRRKLAGQTVQEFYSEDAEPQAAVLTDQITAWVAHNREALAVRPDRLEDVSDRANEISRPLLAIGRVAGAEADTRLRGALHKLFTVGDEKALSEQARMLAYCRDWIARHPDARHIPSRAIMDGCGHNGKQVGAWLSRYDLQGGTYVINGVNAKGYGVQQFQDAFQRYLP